VSWTAWILASSLFLALYDLAKKASVRNNAVLPVLLCSTTCGCLAFVLGVTLAGRLGSVLAVDGGTLALAAAKSVIVATSWIFTFCALRTLPITVATPIRASAPALVFVAAFFLYGEVPTWVQAVGMLAVFGGYWAFSWAGRHEGIDFFRDRAVWCAVVGACCSALSSVWDKYVFQLCGADVEAVQFFFQIGLVVVYAMILSAQRLLRLPHCAWWGRLLRAPVSLLSAVLLRCGMVGSRKLLPFFTSWIVFSWTWGFAPLGTLPELQGRRIICYSCFRFYPPAVLKDCSIFRCAMIHDVIPLRYPGFSAKEYFAYRTNFQTLSRFSELLFHVSRFTQRDFLDLFPQTRARNIVTLLAADEKFHPCSQRETEAVRKKYHLGNKPYFLSIASSGKRKNIPSAAEAFLRFHKTEAGKDMQLVLAGDLSQACPEIQEAPPDGILTPGFIDDADLPALYSGCFAYLFLSDYEGFGLPLLEAMQCAIPVISADNSSLPEVGGDVPLYVNSRDIPGIVSAMNKLVSDPGLYRQCCEKGVERAKLFSWEKHVRIMLDAINSSQEKSSLGEAGS